MIILASTSPTRRSILTNAGVLFSTDRPDVDERALVALNPAWAPRDIAIKLAEAKACEVSARHPGAVVIGADQVLALGDEIFSKPRDRAHCHEQLIRLRGKTHLLISGVVIARNGETDWAHGEEASLKMRDFSDAFLSAYVDEVGDDCTTSVGGYKIEGRGLQLFDTITGDHFTILGLPLLALLARLRQLGEIAS